MLDKCCAIKKAEQCKGICGLNVAVLNRAAGVGLTTALVLEQRCESVKGFSHADSGGENPKQREDLCKLPMRGFAWQV